VNLTVTNVELNVSNIKKLDIKIQKALARIHAHVCGDGWLKERIIKRSPSSRRTSWGKSNYFKDYYVEYYNNEKNLLREFIHDLRTVFGNKFYICITEKKVQVRNKKIFTLLKELGCNKSRSWFISEKILNLTNEVHKAWLCAFIDDEAYIDTKKKEIVLNSVNLNGLKQVGLILKKLQISFTLNGPYKDVYRLRITRRRDLLRLSKMIIPKHPKKRRQWKIFQNSWKV